MKHGCIVMTLRLSRSWSRQIYCCRQKAHQVQSNCKSMFSIFSTSKAFSTRNLYPLVKTSMASFTVRFWSGCGGALGTNVHTSGRKTIGFSTMTKHPITHHKLFDNSWLPKTLQWFPPPPFHLTSSLATFSYSPRWLWLKGRHFDKTQEIHAEMQEIIATLTYENFQGCMKSWETRWDCCIHAQVDYFKRDGGN